MQKILRHHLSEISFHIFLCKIIQLSLDTNLKYSKNVLAFCILLKVGPNAVILTYNYLFFVFKICILGFCKTFRKIMRHSPKILSLRFVFFIGTMTKVGPSKMIQLKVVFGASTKKFIFTDSITKFDCLECNLYFFR